MVILYFFSGVTALGYEVLWARILSLQFGVSIFGVIVTVAAFMLGLGAGSLLMTRILRVSKLAVSQPLLLFAGLEAAVAIFAFVLPALISLVDGLVVGYASSSSLTFWYFLQVSSVILILFIPACALGATFPLVLRVLSNTSITPGILYGVNSAGGALGALLPLLLLPLLGWSNSVTFVAMIGVTISLAAVLLHFIVRRNPSTDIAYASQDSLTSVIDTPDSEITSIENRILLRSYLSYAGIGLAALTLEISWTRLFGMILLRTEYVLAVILSVFLLGIGIGSILGRRLTNPVWLSIFPVLAALCALLSLWGLTSLAAWSATSDSTSLLSALFSQAMAIALLTLPATLVFGAWFPMLNNYITKSQGATAATLYGVNSIGACLGVLISGFLLVPWLGSTGTILAAAGFLMFCGLVWLRAPMRVYYGLAAVVLLVLAIPVTQLPSASKLLPVTQKNTRELYQYEDAVSITHVIERADGQRLLLGDLQRLDASSEPSAISSQLEQARLPLLLHPEPQSVLFLGIGTGISAAGSLGFPSLERTGVELSRGAIIAAEKYFEPVNNGVLGKMSVIRDDARRYLRRTEDRFDVIVGDLFHPDLVGRSALLSVQQFRRVKARLQSDGIFVQWLALQQFDQGNLQVVLRTFHRVFPKALLFVDGFKLALLGTVEDWGGTRSVLHNMARLSDEEQKRVRGGEGDWTRLGRYVGSVRQHLISETGVVQDEWRPHIEFSLPRLRYKDQSSLVNLLSALMERRPKVVDAAETLQVNNTDYDYFERSYMATGLAMMSWMAGLSGDQQEAHRLIRFAHTANPQDRIIGLDLADKMYFSLSQAIAAGISRQDALLRILAIRADHENTLRELWQISIQQGDNEARDRYKARLLQISPLSKNW